MIEFVFQAIVCMLCGIFCLEVLKALYYHIKSEQHATEPKMLSHRQIECYKMSLQKTFKQELQKHVENPSKAIFNVCCSLFAENCR